MTTPTTINLQIGRFCNCEGCIQKVKTAFRAIGGVRIISMNPDDGKFTILTAKRPGIVQFSLQKKLRKTVHIQQETGNLPSSSLVTFPGNVNVNDLANALVTISRAKGLQSVEYTQRNTFKFNFNNPENQTSTSYDVRGFDDGYRNDVPPLPAPPRSTVKASAPLLPESPDQVYGYPPEFYGFRKSSTDDDDDPLGCCPIL